MAKYDVAFYEAILGNKAIAAYRKTIAGNVSVFILDPIDIENNAQVREIILSGDIDSDTAIVKLFSDKEVAYFRKANKKLINLGILEEIPPDGVKREKKEPDYYRYYTNEDIENMLTNKYHKKFEKFLNEYATTPAKLARVIEVAKKLDLRQSRKDAILAKALELGMDLGEDLW